MYNNQLIQYLNTTEYGSNISYFDPVPTYNILLLNITIDLIFLYILGYLFNAVEETRIMLPNFGNIIIIGYSISIVMISIFDVVVLLYFVYDIIHLIKLFF